MRGELTQTEIISLICDALIRDERSYDEKRKAYTRLFPKFTENMPILFEACLKKELDFGYLQMMIKMAVQLDKKEIDILEADKTVYNRLREGYIDPIIPPDKEMLEKFHKGEGVDPNDMSRFKVDSKNKFE